MEAKAFERKLKQQVNREFMEMQIWPNYDNSGVKGDIFAKEYTMRDGYNGRMLMAASCRHGDIILKPGVKIIVLYEADYPSSFDVIDSLFPEEDERHFRGYTFRHVMNEEWFKRKDWITTDSMYTYLK